MAVVAGKLDMDQKQQMTNLNSLTKGRRKEVVPVFLLYLYFKLVVVVKGKPSLWKTEFFCSWTATCRICIHVGLSAFGLYREHEQVLMNAFSCG